MATSTEIRSAVYAANHLVDESRIMLHAAQQKLEEARNGYASVQSSKLTQTVAIMNALVSDTEQLAGRTFSATEQATAYANSV